MKALIFLIAVVIIGVIGFVIFGQTTEAPTTVPQDEVMETEEMEMEAESEASTDAEEDDSMLDVEVLAGAEVDVTNEKVFTLDSFNFGYSDSELRVQEGDTVTINLTNSDGFHDWVVDEFNAATGKIQTGGNTSVTFVADKAGTFEFYCSVGSHRANGMVGKLIVE